MSFAVKPLLGESNPAATLTDKQVVEIRDKRELALELRTQAKRHKKRWQALSREAKRHSIDNLALEYGVSRTTIINLISQRYRKEAL